MPSCSATVTSKTGPGLTVTSLVINNIYDIHFEFQAGRNRLLIKSVDRNYEFDINATTTISCTITAGGNATWTISQ